MLVLIGSSASGKTEIAKILIKDFGFEKMVTYTTRKQRIGETDGVDYHFISEREFIHLLKNNEFVETTYYNEHHYGTRFKDINPKKVLIVDINGANSIYAKLKDQIKIFYLFASESTRIARMKERKDDLQDIYKRIEKDRHYFDPSKLIHIDQQINTEHNTLQELATHIYQLYEGHIQRG
ncbi:MAG TPA: guanylate kinase [Bacilli bacterium]|nr:guanylate kinase [Bacilli bacterium]